MNENEMSYCPHCGKQTTDSFSYCPHCGKPLSFASTRASSDHKEPLMYRSKVGPGTLTVYVIGVLLTIIFSVFGFYICFSQGRQVLPIGVFFIALGVMLSVTLVNGFVRIGKNASRRDPLIEVDEASGNLILHTLYRGDFEVSPKDYVAISRGLSTDFCVKVAFMIAGTKRKFFLGYTQDIGAFLRYVNSHRNG